MKNKNLLVPVIAGIVCLTIGFFAGQKYQQSQVTRFAGRMGMNGGNFSFRTNGQNGQQNRTGFRPITGQIIAADNKSITVKMPDGSSKIVLLSDSTQIAKSDTASKSALTVGANVSVFGTQNSDGIVTASNIQMGNMFRQFVDNRTPTTEQK